MPRPFVKWVGGKTQLLKELVKYIPKNYGKYLEPFVGGGALFFALQPENALLSDSNGELIHAYKMVQSRVEELLQALSDMPNDSDFFYKERAKNPLEMGDIERAARFIYLNKTCFNGLYRVNKRNEFNAPFGKYKNPKICDKGVLRNASKALQNVSLMATYYENALSQAFEGDFVYLDPPYVKVSDTSFTGYSKKGFGIEDHEQLAEHYKNMTDRGVKVLQSNADVPWVRESYADFKLVEVQGRRSINAKGDGRGKVGELFIMNF